MEVAAEMGVLPLSLQTILEQVDQENAKRLVLFDMLPSRPQGAKIEGDYWRILGISKKDQSAKLQVSDTFGLQDNKAKAPITVPLEEPFFIGAYLKDYVYTDKHLSLGQAQVLAKGKVGKIEDLAKIFDWTRDFAYFSKGVFELWKNIPAEDYSLPEHRFSKAYRALIPK